MAEASALTKGITFIPTLPLLFTHSVPSYTISSPSVKLVKVTSELPAKVELGVAYPISVPSNVKTSPLEAPDCNPGILNEVILVSPKVISLFTLIPLA